MNFNNNQGKFALEDIDAISIIIDIINQFKDKILIDKRKFTVSMKDKIPVLKQLYSDNKEEAFKKYQSILKKLEAVIKKDLKCQIFHISGGHGGFIINNIGFCEFDSPDYALDRLIDIMSFYHRNNIPYNIEVAISSLEWLDLNYSKKFQSFLDLFHKGNFEIINPTYSQPYNLLIGPESNIKQFEYGLKVLKKFNMQSEIFYSSESAYHPQIPQILKSFGIKFGSLRTRLKGLNPRSVSANINWIGLDHTAINTLADQSGIFSGEYYHGTYFKQLPDLLFQAVTKPFLKYILYSCIEDFIMPLPYQEEILRISKFSDLFGRFINCTEFFNLTEVDGEYRFRRDDFLIDDSLFLPSELHLQNKNSEISIITAEIINSILSLFNIKSQDSFFDDLWKKLLITQSHDCYAVPFIRSGDYIRSQLNAKDSSNIKLNGKESPLFNLCIDLHKDIQKNANRFILQSLKKIIEKLQIKSEDSNDTANSIIIFNPTAYLRRDIVSIDLNSPPPGFTDLVSDGVVSDYYCSNSKLNFITKLPGFGYKIYNFEKEIKRKKQEKSNFLFKSKIISDFRTIEIQYKDVVICELKFSSEFDYKLKLEEEYKNNLEQRKVIMGHINSDQFKLEIIQYNGINRLEFILDSNMLNHIIITPKVKIRKSYINYPFGIEETNRSSIQSLDFLWLTNEREGILYIQKNCPKFTIDRKNFEIKNHINLKGRFEFAISITSENNIKYLKKYVDLYHFRLKGIVINKTYKFIKFQDTFLTIKPSLPVTNLWRREDNVYVRLLNPSDDDLEVSIEGALQKGFLKETNLKNMNIKDLKSNKIRIKPWKIKTLRL